MRSHFSFALLLCLAGNCAVLGADGRTLHLAFSGNDSFSVREVQCILWPQTDTIISTNR